MSISAGRCFGISLAAFILSAMTALAQSPPKVCGLSSGGALHTLQDSIDETQAHVSSVVATGLGEVSSLPDVQNLMASINSSSICATTLVLSKNDYQYQKILVVLRQVDAAGKVWVTPMIFQTASIQALENMYAKPWVGFGRTDFAATLRKSIAQATLTPSLQSVASPLDLLPKLFPSTSLPIDGGSASYALIPDVDPEWTTFLVSQLRVLDTGNPFTSNDLTEVGVVQIQESTGQIRSGVLSGFFDTEGLLEDLQAGLVPSDSSASAHLVTLKNLSTP